MSANQVSAGSSTATVSWKTDENSDSAVDFGTTTAYGSSVADASLVTVHSLALRSLSPATTYHYQAKSKDKAGNLATSGDLTFMTTPPSADLVLSGTLAPDPVQVGAQLTYTLSVQNKGPQPASAVTLSDTLPANTSLVSATASQGSCTPSAGTVSCALGGLALGYSAQVLADQPLGYWRLDETPRPAGRGSSGQRPNRTPHAGGGPGRPPPPRRGGGAGCVPPPRAGLRR